MWRPCEWRTKQAGKGKVPDTATKRTHQHDCRPRDCGVSCSWDGLVRSWRVSHIIDQFGCKCSSDEAWIMMWKCISSQFYRSCWHSRQDMIIHFQIFDILESFLAGLFCGGLVRASVWLTHGSSSTEHTYASNYYRIVEGIAAQQRTRNTWQY
jgi:hypothetical protein